MKKLIVFTMLVLSTALFGQYPLSLSDSPLATPAIISLGDSQFIGVGGADSVFHVVEFGNPESYHVSIPLDGPVTRTAAIYESTFIVQTTNGLVYRFDTEGNLFDEWPIDIGESSPYSCPAVSDGLGIFTLCDNSLFLITESGDLSEIATFDSDYGAVASMAVGDVDDDGEVEIAFPGWDKFFVFNLDGSNVDGFPAELPSDWKFSYSSPVILDFDNDGIIEIACGAHEIDDFYLGGIYVFRVGEGVLESSPFGSTGHTGSWVYATPTPIDYDFDNLPELVFMNSAGNLVAVDSNDSLAVNYRFSGDIVVGSIVAHTIDDDRAVDITYFYNTSDDSARVNSRILQGSPIVSEDIDFKVGDSFSFGGPVFFEGSREDSVGIALNGLHLVTTSEGGKLYSWFIGPHNTLSKAMPKWQSEHGSMRNDGVYPEPPSAIEISQRGTNCTIVLSPPDVSPIASIGYSLYAINPYETSPSYELIYEGASEISEFTVDSETTFVYATCNYINETESGPIIDTVYLSESVFDIAESQSFNSIDITPSPFIDKCLIDLPSNAKRIIIGDPTGRILLDKFVDADESLEFSPEYNGSAMFMLMCYDSNNKLIATKKTVRIR